MFIRILTCVKSNIESKSSLTVGITADSTTINVESTDESNPSKYGLLKVNNEIITYTGITTNSFTGY